MVNINTAGCAAVWGGSSPTISYTKNRNGHGPCFGYSLFENEAEYGFGMYMGANEVRKNLAREVGCLVKTDIPDDVREAMQEWLDGFDDPAETRERADKLETALERYKDDSALAGIYGKRHYFIKRSCLPGVPHPIASPAGATPITPIIGLTGILIFSENSAKPFFMLIRK